MCKPNFGNPTGKYVTVKKWHKLENPTMRGFDTIEEVEEFLQAEADLFRTLFPEDENSPIVKEGLRLTTKTYQINTYQRMT